MQLVVAMRPRPVPLDLFSRLPAPTGERSSGAELPSTPAPPATTVVPLSPGLRRLHVTIDQGFAADLDRAKARRTGLGTRRGTCAFVGSTGIRCGSTHQVQFHHIVPFARGGEATVANVSLRCSHHNFFQAEKDYGTEFLEHRRGHAAAKAGNPS